MEKSEHETRDKEKPKHRTQQDIEKGHESRTKTQIQGQHKQESWHGGNLWLQQKKYSTQLTQLNPSLQRPWDPKLKRCYLHHFKAIIITVAAKLKVLVCIPPELGAQAQLCKSVNNIVY